MRAAGPRRVAVEARNRRVAELRPDLLLHALESPAQAGHTEARLLSTEQGSPVDLKDDAARAVFLAEHPNHKTHPEDGTAQREHGDAAP